MTALMLTASCSSSLSQQEAEPRPATSPSNDSELSAVKRRAALAAVASVMEVPVESLRLLDYERVSLVFSDRQIWSLRVRDLSSRRRVTVSVDLNTKEQVDPEKWRRRDRDKIKKEATRLDPSLRSLVLRHPDMGLIRVRLRWALEAAGSTQSEARESRSNTQSLVKFQKALDAELKRNGVLKKVKVPMGFQPLELQLSCREAVKLGSIKLVKDVVLVDDPIIED